MSKEGDYKTFLIHTKLQRPSLAQDLIQRPHLIDHLNRGLFRKLTLISAPAGYGKSTLAGIWQKACDCPVAWLSIDKNDNDPGVFLSYFIGALQTIFPGICKNTTALLNGLQLPPLPILTTSLINETAVLSQPFLLVLDDFHLIHNPDIHEIIHNLIQYQSPQMRLVLITRQDPPLDIVTLRAKGELTEIRLTELRFSKNEAQQYLNRHLGKNAPVELVEQIFHHTEGWIVGMRLAILALRNQLNQVQFLETFQLNNQYVMSYLVNEVLSHQPEEIQTFLLSTSLLDRFCAPLCDALFNTEEVENPINSRDILEYLCQENLFLIPLDQQREWVRYHHLFQDLLRQQLKTAVSDTTINQLHTRASNWFAQHGFIEEALDHAFAANDMQQAIQIMAQVRYHLMNETEWQRLEHLLRRFPQKVIEHSPNLFIAETWLCYHRTQYTKLPAMLAHLKQLIQKTTIPSESRIHFLGEISAIQSLLSYFDMDIENTRTQAEKALAQTPPELWIVRVFARMMLAGAQQMTGNLSSAYATILSNFDKEFVQTNLFKATTLVTSCNVAWMAADINTIGQHAAQAINFCREVSSPEICGVAQYHAGSVAYLQSDLAAAEKHFVFVQQQPYANYGDSFVYSSCGLALTYQAQGRSQEARDVVDTALAFLLTTGNVLLTMAMQAFQAELALQQGQLSAALQWAAQFDSIPPLTPMYRLYAPHFTLVKIWLAENTENGRQKAANLLAQIKTFLETIHNNIFLIDTLILQATIYHTEHNEADALTALEQALNMALPGHIIRPFVEQGSVLGNLLPRLTIQDDELAAFITHILQNMAYTVQQPVDAREGNNVSPLLEPLTDRELDLLYLLCKRQTDKEIAQKLQISPHTVHSHIKNIYTKLDVNNRRQAASRALELGLVMPY